MQFKVQTLVKPNKSLQKEEDELDLFVGLYSPLNSPYNIFLRLKDIENNNDIIYFYAYSMGSQKVMVWGLYDTNTNEFLIDNSCQYTPNQLMEIINTWKQNKYDYFFTAMRDRKSERINQYLIYGDDREKNLKLADNFKNYYLSKLSKEGLISSNVPKGPKDKDINIEKLFDKVYEAGLSSIKQNKYKNILNLILNELDTKEDETTIFNIIKNNKWDGTEYQINVAKHILVHLFLMVFLTIDDYRVAKYINYIQTHNNNNNEFKKKLMKHVKNSFLYQWILELAKVLRVYDVENFMLLIANNILSLIENDINMNNINMSLGINIRDKISDISERFEDFIAKSMYSKITFVNNLPSCPKITSCNDNGKGCDLYSHGVTTFSKYDQT